LNDIPDAEWGKAVSHIVGKKLMKNYKEAAKYFVASF